MSSFRPFVRQLGYQPGVQLNPLADQTDGVSPGNSDQAFGALGRFTRGRIDRPFRVNRGNFLAKTGSAESIRTNALNEAKLQIYEALNNGAVEAVVMRLAPEDAEKKWAIADFTVPAATVFSVAATASAVANTISVMHHDCYNDGIKLAIHADATPIGGVAVANTDITLRIFDSKDVLLHEFQGSTLPSALDDFGQSRYLPDIVARQGADAVEVVVGSAAIIATTSDAYGRSAAGADKWAASGVLVCFDEGGTTYAASDYDRCIAALRDTDLAHGYLISGGTQVISLVGKLAALAIEANMPLKNDIPGNLSPEAVIAYVQSLNIDSHYIHHYWAPLEADDPMNGGRAVWGASGLNVGYSCARNARIDSKGFAPKNYPIAGKEYPVNRTNVRQLYRPTEQELSDLAKVQVNPVIFKNYNGGGRFVFSDSLTSAKTVVGYKKLISVAEMSASLDNWVTLYGNELVQLPMRDYIKRMNAFLDRLLPGAQTAGWLMPAKNLPNNAAFAFDVRPSEARPADLVHITYFTSFDGVARQAIVQQTLTK